jgi:hypothetical protein
MGDVSVVLVAQLVTTAAYAGFQWTVHVVVYPQLGAVPDSAFTAYERSHERRIGYVVGPLFAGLVVTTALLWFARPAGTSTWGPALSWALLLAVLGITGLLAVPLHRRLERGWDPSTHRRLLRVDALRLAAATADVAVAVVIAVQ